MPDLRPQVGDSTNLLLKKLVTATQALSSGGGLFLTEAEANALYFRLDGSNSPFTKTSATVVTVPDAFSLTSLGSIALQAGGSNQNITLTPSGTGGVGLRTSGTTSTSVAVLGSGATTTPNYSTWLSTTVPVASFFNEGSNSNGTLNMSYAGSSVSTLYMQRATGTLATPTAIVNGDTTGQVVFSGYDGGAFRNTASIAAIADNTISSGNMPQRIAFLTGTTTSRTERMDIASSGAIRIPSTNTAGLQLYNTADQTTNYERAEFKWNTGPVFEIRSTASGSGGTVIRPISMIGSVGSVYIDNTSSTGQIQLSGSSTGSTSAVAVRLNNFTSTATSGSIVGGLSITPTYNQASGTAANTDLLVNRTQTAVGSGAQLLADFQVGGSSKFSVSNVSVATLTHTSNPTLTITDGTVIGFMGVNTSGIKAQLGTNSNHVVEILQNGGLAVSFGTSKQATFAGALITTPQALSGAGAVNLTTSSTHYTSTGGAQALTLANGTVGQRKNIIHVVDGGSGVLTPTTALGYTTITFTNVGDAVDLEYTAAGWAVVGFRGAVIA